MWERSAEAGKCSERGWAAEEQFSKGPILKRAGTFLLVLISLYYLKLILKWQVSENPSIFTESSVITDLGKKKVHSFIVSADLYLDSCE